MLLFRATVDDFLFVSVLGKRISLRMGKVREKSASVVRRCVGEVLREIMGMVCDERSLIKVRWRDYYCRRMSNKNLAKYLQSKLLNLRKILLIQRC